MCLLIRISIKDEKRFVKNPKFCMAILILKILKKKKFYLKFYLITTNDKNSFSYAFITINRYITICNHT